MKNSTPANIPYRPDLNFSQRECSILSMRCRATFVFIVTAWIVLCGFRQVTAPQPGATPQKISKEGQQNSGHHETGAISPSQPPPSRAEDNGGENGGRNDQSVHLVTPEKAAGHVESVIGLIGIVCTVVLTVVGVIGICVALRTVAAIQRQSLIMIRQSRIMQRQANTMEKQTDATIIAANAAKANADALINIERAWLIPSNSVSPKLLPTVRLRPVQTEELNLQIRNFGNTPAWITDYFFEVIVSKDTDVGKHGINASPEENYPNARPLPPGQIEDFTIQWKIENPTEIDDIRDGKKYLYVRGYVTYRSAVGKGGCYSGICFRYFRHRNPYGLIQEGWAMIPPEENHYS
jgi:hypothetical protein